MSLNFPWTQLSFPIVPSPSHPPTQPGWLFYLLILILSLYLPHLYHWRTQSNKPSHTPRLPFLFVNSLALSLSLTGTNLQTYLSLPLVYSLSPRQSFLFVNSLALSLSHCCPVIHQPVWKGASPLFHYFWPSVCCVPSVCCRIYWSHPLPACQLSHSDTFNLDILQANMITVAATWHK